MGEQLLVAFSDNGVPKWNVRKWTVIQEVSLRNELRADGRRREGRRRREGGRGKGSFGEGCAGLQRHPDGLAVVDLGNYRPLTYFEMRCPLCMIAPVSAARSDGATNHTRCAVKLPQLGYTFLYQWLTRVLLTHVLHETSI